MTGVADGAADRLVGDDSQRPDRTARLKEIESLIERGLSMISPEHREIIVLREVQGLDYDTIADVIRCRKGTVKSRLARAREQLRQRLTELGGEWL
ncbi:MAG: sigma-70 family RNA polymerase sigma factor [Candidatus Hydrogenedentes bacterium]|nr:sigma-70 family RNA polymerase sigma factor [Candidatus Hydrogenedentota bacterium]